ncbi:MAG TPA: endopeptidase La, partial [Gammaproteobacteria bacterium]|nr:endopeptidase La [Gammaproteobacteria bacterium]
MSESKTEAQISLPLLPLRDVVVYPNMVMPLFVGRELSIAALDAAMGSNKQIFLVAQKSPEHENPGADDVYEHGCVASVLQLLKLPDGTVKVLVEGIKRVKILDFKDQEKFISCTFEHLEEQISKDEDLLPLALTAIKRLEKLTIVNKKLSTETINS